MSSPFEFVCGAILLVQVYGMLMLFVDFKTVKDVLSFKLRKMLTEMKD